MKVSVMNPKKLKAFLSSFIKNKKVLVNFKCDGRILSLQVLNEYTVCCDFEVSSQDNDYKMTDVTVYLTKVMNVLTDEDDILIAFTSEALYLEQGTFSCIAVKEYEARREFPELDYTNMKKIPTGRIKSLISNASGLGNVFKEMKVFETDPVIVGNKFYQNATANSNIVYMDKFEFPTCCIPIKSLRECIYTFGKEVTYSYFPKSNVIYFLSESYEYWIPTLNYNIEGNTIQEIERIATGCQTITTINLFPYLDRLKIVSDAFPNRKLQLVIGKDTFQIQVSLNDATVTIGDEVVNYICSLSITSGVLLSLIRIYNDEGFVEVKKGANCILMQKDGMRKVLLSALIN